MLVWVNRTQVTSTLMNDSLLTNQDENGIKMWCEGETYNTKGNKKEMKECIRHFFAYIQVPR